MSQTYTLTIVCDDRRSPDCHGERVESHPQPRAFDHLAVDLFREGWQRGYRGDGSAQTYDVCPACVPGLPALERAPTHEHEEA
jgi:hypothetical protein